MKKKTGILSLLFVVSFIFMPITTGNCSGKYDHSKFEKEELKWKSLHKLFESLGEQKDKPEIQIKIVNEMIKLVKGQIEFKETHKELVTDFSTSLSLIKFDLTQNDIEALERHWCNAVNQYVLLYKLHHNGDRPAYTFPQPFSKSGKIKSLLHNLFYKTEVERTD